MMMFNYDFQDGYNIIDIDYDKIQKLFKFLILNKIISLINNNKLINYYY